MPTDKSIKKLGVKEAKDIPLQKEEPLKLEKVDHFNDSSFKLPDYSLTVQEKIWYQWLPKTIQVGAVLAKNTIFEKVFDVITLIKGGDMPEGSIVSGIKSSPKSTWLGVASLLTVISTTATALLDGDPNTNPDWPTVIPAVVGAFGLIFGKFGKS